FETLEDWAARRFDAIVTSTPHIRKRFEKLGAKALDVCNFPILEELVRDTPWESRRNEVCYIGGISRIRGIEPIVAALPDTSTRLNLAGPWSESDLKAKLTAQPGWARVNDLGLLDRKDVIEVLAKSKIGLVTLFPTPNYVDALPIKLFEYMAAGMPVIASDFPVWREIVADAGHGRRHAGDRQRLPGLARDRSRRRLRRAGRPAGCHGHRHRHQRTAGR
ncbi:glycosyltransferase, partial (plasmid) [Chromobacterium amazonense]|uniref:glycosyltransferase n=1 Tax=Chromobacterium amazonense TaxID=1382803 RepID=UPI00237E1FAC